MNNHLIQRLKKIVEELYGINKNLKNKNIFYAIDFLNIAILELGGEFESKMKESLLHFVLKKHVLRNIKNIEGIYFEAKDLKFQKYGYRPDIVLITKDEIIFVEAETKKERIPKKIEKLKFFLKRISEEKHLEPVLKCIKDGDKRLKVIFVTNKDVNEKSFMIDGDIDIKIVKMMNDPVSER